MSRVERHGSCHPVSATARTVPWSRYTRPLLPLRENLGPPCHGRNHVSLISRGARGSEAGARGSGLAAERRSVVVMVWNHDTGLRHRRGLMAQDYDTGRGLSVLPGYAPTPGRSSGRRWAGHVDHRPVHAGRPPRPEHVRGWASCSGSHRLSACSAMNVTVRQSEQPTLVLLFCFGFLVGLAMADDGLHHPGVAPAGPCPGGAVRARELLLGARSNPFLLVAVLGAVAVQLAILYLPALQRLFATQALSPFQLALVLVASTAAFVAGGAGEVDPPPTVPKVPPDTGLMVLLHRPPVRAGWYSVGEVRPSSGCDDGDHHLGGTDHAATPGRTTVGTPTRSLRWPPGRMASSRYCWGTINALGSTHSARVR
jgi:hypothetical protein